MVETPQRRRPVQQRDRLPRSVPILAAVVAVLLIVKGILVLVGWPLKPQEPSQMQLEIPSWIDQQLLPVNPYSRPGTPLEEINGVVVHYVGNPGTTASQNRNYFAGLAQQTQEPYTSVSSHFLIGLEGEILQIVPLDEISYCSYPRNGDTVAIECCHPDDTGAFTPETYESLLRLVRWLMDECHLDTSQILRHYDVVGKECPRYFVQNPESWDTFLTDLENLEKVNLGE